MEANFALREPVPLIEIPQLNHAAPAIPSTGLSAASERLSQRQGGNCHSGQDIAVPWSPAFWQSGKTLSPQHLIKFAAQLCLCQVSICL